MRKFVFFLLLLVACAPAEIASAPTPAPEIAPPAQEPVEPVAEKVAQREPVVEKVTESVPVPEVSDECETFGCPGAKIVADMQMDLFYECTCPRAKWIKPELILCFASEEEAVASGYRKAQSC